MNIRTLVKLTMLAGLLALVAPVQAADPLAAEFAKPPQEAKPWVYWWFEGGWGNPAGMARDLAAMKEKGIGGVMHMQTINVAGLPLPSQPKMLSPEWEAWFGEALRLAHESGMTMSASIVDGWAHGGWWVGKEDGAKQMVYSETQVDGPGALAEPLPQPLTRLGVYHDVAVVAFKEKTQRPPTPLDVKANNVFGGYCGEENWPAAHAVDGDPQTYWRTAKACAPEAPAQLDAQYAQPIRAVAVQVSGMPKAGPAECELQVSDDGKVFRGVAHFTMEPGESKRVAFDPVTARWFRLAVLRAHAPDLQLAEFTVLRQGDEPVLRPGIKWWDFKSANRAWWGWPTNPYEALEEEYTEDGACDVSPADVVDLTSHLQADGRLDWQAPAGRWTVLRFGWTPLGEPARMGSGGYEVDVLNTRSADLMMDSAAKQMRELSVQKAGGAPIVFHTDSWEIGAGVKGQQLTWTGDFREQFQKRRGYDLLSYLPALARRIVKDRQTTDRFLCDYRATVADLLAAYYGRLQERAHQMNGEINAESGYGSYPHPHMDGLQVFGRSDRPMAEFWHRFPGFSVQYLQWVDIMRTAASGARIYGHRFVQAETLTAWSGVSMVTSPADYRRTLHEAWARGLNQAVIHKYTHQPFEEKPGMLDYDIFNRHIAWWPLADGLIGYMGRCQSLLQQGDFVADAAYFVGEGATRFVPGKKFLNPALPDGYDYDGINAEVLQTRAAVKDGRLVLPKGPSYRYLVLCDPQCATMNADTLGRIRQLVEQGLTLVGKRPLRTPGLSDLDSAEARLKKDADALWGAQPAEQGDRKVGKGRVLWGRPVGELLAADGVVPDCQASSAGVSGKPMEITWLHRKSETGEIYFLANPLTQPVDVTVALRAQGQAVQLFDPLDGSSRDLPEKSVSTDGRTTVPLHFEPEQAFFVVLREGKASPVGGRNFPALKPVLAVEGPWQVSFDAAWVKPLPAGVVANAPKVTVPFDQLTDWTKSPEAGIKNYSGVATYRKTFDLPGDVALARPLFLAVGEVKEMARVTINGKDLGVTWCPPWRVTIPAGLLKTQGNELVIEVANTWNNRLLTDASLAEQDRVTRIGKQYYKWMLSYSRPYPAGLLGPVRVMGEE